MAYLAEAGFDTFTMDHTGYGRSPRPMMDDACNMSPEDQAQLMPQPLKQTYDTLTKGRWDTNVAWETQVGTGIRDVIWQTIMAVDLLGSVWGPGHGIMRVRTSGPYTANGFQWSCKWGL